MGDLDGEPSTHEIWSQVTETRDEFGAQLRGKGRELVLCRELAEALNLFT